MGDLADYREARSRLRLGPYERWQVKCITNLLKRHDDRVAAEQRLRIGRRTSATMLARQDAGRRVSSIPPYGWMTQYGPGDSRRSLRNNWWFNGFCAKPQKGRANGPSPEN